MAKPNYQFKKRQKEIAKKEKQDLKKQRKMDQKTNETDTQQDHILAATKPMEIP